MTIDSMYAAWNVLQSLNESLSFVNEVRYIHDSQHEGELHERLAKLECASSDIMGRDKGRDGPVRYRKRRHDFLGLDVVLFTNLGMAVFTLVQCNEAVVDKCLRSAPERSATCGIGQ